MNPLFFPIVKPDGSKAYVNIAQAAEISLTDNNKCLIKFIDGGVVEIDDTDGVMQAIRPSVVNVDALPRANKK